ncbi:MAG: threonylcarbamoyl-AMP synthase, partial [Bacteroidales bacterium]
MKAFETSVSGALKTLINGGTILYPTDTIWGIGCDATNTEAVGRIFQIKNRPDSKSMLVLISSIRMLEEYVTIIPEKALEILRSAKTPLTIIYPQARNFAEPLIHVDGSIGIRLTQDELCTSIINRFGKPLVSTSANFSGSPYPRSFFDIDPELKKKVD